MSQACLESAEIRRQCRPPLLASLVRVSPSFAILAATFLTVELCAHQMGETYAFLDIVPNGISGRVEVTLSDLDEVFSLDQDRNGKISADEVEAKATAARSYIAERFSLGTESADGQELPFRLDWGAHAVINAPLGKFFQVKFATVDSGQLPETLLIEMSTFVEEQPQHRGILVIASDSRTGLRDNHENESLVFTAENSKQRLDVSTGGFLRQLLLFIKEGIWHIWIGLDHILFLIALLIPSVLTRKSGEWQPLGEFRSALWNVVKIVSVFTIAHSITLSLATLGWIELSPAWVESVIAASVFVAALNCLFPVVRESILLVIFAFGLFHGFGFASVLGHLSVNRAAPAVPLIGFNVGVELGQIAIVCVTFPILWLLRTQKFYKPLFLWLGSATIAAMALYWFIERVEWGG